jgi:RNA polymerase sigma-70 factor (ECF subfamily)
MNPARADADRTLAEYHAYLETLTFIQVDPRLRGKFGLSDIIQNTLLEAYRDLERIQDLGEADRKRWLRRMLMNNLLQEIDRWRTGRRDVRLERSLEAAAYESSCRLREGLAAEDSSPSERLLEQERDAQLLEALAKLDSRQREALILQHYHHWTLAQVAEHLGCTTGAVAGLHARGLKALSRHLPGLE